MSTALLALAVLVSTLAGGTSYLFCAMTDSVVSQCCCEPESNDGAAQAEIQRFSDCCAQKTADTLPQGIGSATAVVFAAMPANAEPAAIAIAGAPCGVLSLATRAPTGPPQPYGRARPEVLLL